MRHGPLRNSILTILAFVTVQAAAMSVGWFFVYNATYERIAESVDEVIIDNNRRVAQSLVDAIGELPSTFDPEHADWKRAQELVESVDFGSGGFACILDEDGYIACHPDMQTNPGLRNLNLAQHAFRPIGSGGAGGVGADAGALTIGEAGADAVDVGIADFAVDGRHYVATKTITASGKRLLVHQPVSGLTAASDQVTAGLLVRIGLAGAPVLLFTACSGVVFMRAHSRAFRRWNRELEGTVAERTRQLQKSRHAIVTALATLADYRDNETGQHVLRISEYTVVLARTLRDRFPARYPEIDDAWIERLRLASMLHDIGKVGVPDAVLRKPGRLTDAEYAVIKSHPSFGADTLLKVHREVEDDPLIEMAVEVCLYHHERWDTTGYPVGIGAADIPLSARITAVADVFDALMSPRVYKPAMPIEQVRAIIAESAGTHFDPAVVEAFLEAQDELCAIRARLAEPEAPRLAA